MTPELRCRRLSRFPRRLFAGGGFEVHGMVVEGGARALPGTGLLRADRGVRPAPVFEVHDLRIGREFVRAHAKHAAQRTGERDEETAGAAVVLCGLGISASGLCSPLSQRSAAATRP